MFVCVHTLAFFNGKCEQNNRQEISARNNTYEIFADIDGICAPTVCGMLTAGLTAVKINGQFSAITN